MKDKTNKIVVKYYFPVLFESLKLFYISIIIAKNKKIRLSSRNTYLAKREVIIL